MDMNLSEHFTLREAVYSETAARNGIDNRPTPKALANLQITAQILLEPLLAQFGPIRITSGYRSPALNQRIAGSSSSSAHLHGLAFDIQPIADGVTLRHIMSWVVESSLPFDQVIYEYGAWIHIGGSVRIPRRQALMKFVGSGYEKWDADDPRVGA